MSTSQILADKSVAQATPPQNKIAIPSDLLADFCRRHHIRKLAFFGSVLRDDFNSASDVDVLVEFEPNYRIGLIKMAGIEIELGQMLGRKVDLRTPADLSRYFRQKVVASAEIKYVRE